MAGDVADWPDNMAQVAAKGGCLQGIRVSNQRVNLLYMEFEV